LYLTLFLTLLSYVHALRTVSLCYYS